MSTVTERLEYLRGELRAERISWGELAELQSLAEHIDPGDVELLEAAGVPEHDESGSPDDGMLDKLASLARTALDDPEALDDPAAIAVRWLELPALREAYAIEKLDEIIEALNPSYEARETFAATLTILGRHLAERADVMQEVDADEESGEKEAYEQAATLVGEALDKLDEAIDTLRNFEPEEEYVCEDCNVNGEDCRTHGEAFKLAREAIYANPGRAEKVLRASLAPEWEPPGNWALHPNARPWLLVRTRLQSRCTHKLERGLSMMDSRAKAQLLTLLARYWREDGGTRPLLRTMTVGELAADLIDAVAL